MRYATALTLLCSASAFAQPSFDAVPVGTLGGPSSAAYGVNSQGVVVGASDTFDGPVRAFAFVEQIVDLGTRAGDVSSAAYSINDANIIVGESRDAQGVLHPVYWTPDADGLWAIHDLATLGGVFGTATRINASGQIAGYTSPAVGGYHAVIWTNGVPEDLGTLSYTGNLAYSQALGLNDAGDAVGYAYRVLGGPEHGYFKAPGGRQLDITPAVSFGLAQGHNINAAGFICGHISGQGVTDGAFRAAIRDPLSGVWTLLPLLEGHSDAYAFDIDQANAIVGVSFLPSSGPGTGDFRGYLWQGGVTYDLNALTRGAPAQINEARDIAPTGMIAATAGNEFASVGLRLVPGTTPPCDPDLNQDGNTDQDDLAYLINVIGGGDNPTGIDPDFNHDGNPDQDDLAALIDVLGGGTCPR